MEACYVRFETLRPLGMNSTSATNPHIHIGSISCRLPLVMMLSRHRPTLSVVIFPVEHVMTEVVEFRLVERCGEV